MDSSSVGEVAICEEGARTVLIAWPSNSSRTVSIKPKYSKAGKLGSRIQMSGRTLANNPATGNRPRRILSKILPEDSKLSADVMFRR